MVLNRKIPTVRGISIIIVLLFLEYQQTVFLWIELMDNFDEKLSISDKEFPWAEAFNIGSHADPIPRPRGRDAIFTRKRSSTCSQAQPKTTRNKIRLRYAHVHDKVQEHNRLIFIQNWHHIIFRANIENVRLVSTQITQDIKVRNSEKTYKRKRQIVFIPRRTAVLDYTIEQYGIRPGMISNLRWERLYISKTWLEFFHKNYSRVFTEKKLFKELK